MKKIIFTLTFLLLTQTVFVSAQQDDDSEVVKINTDLIQIDATVTGKNGKVITDLKPEDFEIYENGVKRQITGFSFVAGDDKISVATGDLLTSANSNLSDSAPQTATQVGRILAIVVDDLQLSKVGIDSSKKDLANFIRQQVQPNDLVAVLKTSGSVGILQQFTHNKEQLLRAVESIKWNPTTSSGFAQFAPSEISFSQEVAGGFEGVSGKFASLVANRTDIEKLGGSLRDEINTVGSLQVLKQTIDALGYLKGRKTILLVAQGVGIKNTNYDDRLGINDGNTNRFYSEGDKAVINTTNINEIRLNSQNSMNVAGRDFSINNFLRVITEAANRNSVTIYPIDPNGAVATNLSAVDNTQGTIGIGAQARTNDQGDQVAPGRNDLIRRSQDSLRYLARETGGRAVINNNKAGDEIREIFEEQKGYYLLAYEPNEETFNAKESRFNKLEVKVKRSGADISYRSGFFNVVAENRVKEPTREQTILQKLLAPYNFGDIPLEIASISVAGERGGATIRSFVNIKPSGLQIGDAADGKKSAKFDVFVAIFNESGIPLGSSARNYAVSFDAKSYDNFLKSGIVTNLAFNVPKAGVYRVKVLVADNQNNKIGTTSQSIFVSDLEKHPLGFSGILLQNFTSAEWQEVQKNPAAANPGRMQTDTAFRHYKKGTILTYTYAVSLAPSLAKNGDSKVVLTTKLLRDGRVIFTGKPEEIALAATKVNRRGAVNLGTDMAAGKYTLQITATSDKTGSAEAESIDFEVVK